MMGGLFGIMVNPVVAKPLLLREPTLDVLGFSFLRWDLRRASGNMGSRKQRLEVTIRALEKVVSTPVDDSRCQ